MSEVSVKPEILEWAQERARLDRDALRKPFPKYDAWLTGEKKPTLRQLEQFARKTMTPLGYFFLEEPPEDKLPIPDFRTLDDLTVARPSPNLLETIQTMQRRQDWMREYLLDLGQDRLPFVGSVKRLTKPKEVAARIRESLGLGIQWSRKSPNWEDAFRTLREATESAGILLFFNSVAGGNNRRRLDVQEFRGFVLLDDYAPLVFINAADARAAQMFTLVHELAHVWTGREGVSNLPHLMANSQQLEKFCNQVAAEFLVPESPFERAWDEMGDEDDAFLRLAREFKVSPLVVARRALDLEYIDRSHFFGFYDSYMSQFQEAKAEQRRKAKESGGGPSPYTVLGARLDRRFVKAVVRSAKEGRLLYRDAYSLTGLRGKTFDEFAARSGA